MLLDIHTHRLAANPATCIVNYTPADFMSAVQSGEASCFCSVGIHPWQAGEATEEDWQQMEQAATLPAVVAIGEAGLDKLASPSLTLQADVFIRQVDLSESTGKPLIIHCVKAFNELVVIKRQRRPRQPWIVHGFRNNLNIARTLLDEGIRLSLGERFQPSVLAAVHAAGWLVTETDESPADIHALIGRMALLLDEDPNTLCRCIDEQARHIFFSR